ncbi:MAG: asparaginase, partial [Comamonas sp.]|nr:asparaginase [Comamonas sp.]
VEVVHSHAGARGTAIDALVTAGVQGIVLAGTGNGTVHQDLEVALARARAQGVQVRRCTRCAMGAVVQAPNDSADKEVSHLNPWKTRISLMLALMGQQA